MPKSSFQEQQLGKTVPEAAVIRAERQKYYEQEDARAMAFKKAVGQVLLNNFVPPRYWDKVINDVVDLMLQSEYNYLALKEEIIKNELELQPYLTHFFSMTPMEADFVSILLEKTYTSKESMYNFLFGLRVSDPPGQKILDVVLCRVRRKLKSVPGFEIKTVWARGYSVSNEARQSLVDEINRRKAK